MALTRRALLGTTGSCLLLTGCLGGGSAGGGGDGASGTVRTRSHASLDEILVDADGRTLYRFDADSEGATQSACSGGCAEAWPPLVVDGEPTAGSGVSAALSTIERADGTRQVTAAGWPLYTYASDESPGDVKGQGVNDVWWVVAPDGAKITASAGAAGGGY